MFETPSLLDRILSAIIKFFVSVFGIVFLLIPSFIFNTKTGSFIVYIIAEWGINDHYILTTVLFLIYIFVFDLLIMLPFSEIVLTAVMTWGFIAELGRVGTLSVYSYLYFAYLALLFARLIALVLAVMERKRNN